MTDELPIVIRAPDPGSVGERKFITEASCHARQPCNLPWNAWLPMYSPAVREARRDSASVTRVAEVDGVIVGFVIVKAGRLFMLYVKQKLRGERIGLRLLKAAMPGLIVGPVGLEIPVTGDLVTPSFRNWCRGHGFEFELPPTEG